MRIDRRTLLASGLVGGVALAATGTAPTLTATVKIANASGPLPHIWEESAGSDRAATTLRESWRRDLDRWHREAGLKRVRFHGIFADELGVYAPGFAQRGAPTVNFQNIDQVYDGLIAHGVSPFVELSFMPKALASGDRAFGFYAANVTPPTSVEAWGGFITQFARHLVARYGAPAVRTWPFEVWNEPNLASFWSGSQQQYFDLYKATAVALKSVDPALMVGGPATASAAWISDFLNYCATDNAPVDFVSTHAYAGDNQSHLFGPGTHLPQADVIPEAVRRTRATIDGSRFAKLPLWLSEWSSDSPAMIAHVLSKCLPHAHALSHWVMSGTYEELGPADYVLREGSMGWTTMILGVAKPSFNTYKLLHALGRTRLESDGPVLASRRDDGRTAALLWNLAEVSQPAGLPGATRPRTVVGERKNLRVRFDGARAGQPVRISFVDQERGSPLPAWRAMGSPQYPTAAQVEALRRSADLAPPVPARLDRESSLTLDLPPEGVALVEFA